jgi:hypothetical protein
VPGDVGAYAWADGDVADLGTRVHAVVGNRDDAIHDSTRRTDDDGDLFDGLRAVASEYLGRRLTAAEAARLRTLFRGGASRLRRDDHDDNQRRPAKASAIALAIVCWRAGIGERAAKKLQRELRKGERPALEIFLRL